MSIHTIVESKCHFLFGKEAQEIFANTEFVEQSLDLSMRIHEYLLTHRDGFFLADPRAFNNQCHLYSLIMAQIKKFYHLKTEEEKRAATDENRLLHLALFLNYSLCSYTKLLVKVALTAIRQMGIQPFNQQFTKKRFVQFLRDDGRSREIAARRAFNRVFERYMKDVLLRRRDESPLAKDLYELSQEDLRIQGVSLGFKFEKLYTYPKLAGVAYMVDVLAQEHIPFVIKVKVFNSSGHGGVIRYASGEADPQEPVLVFEGFATDGSRSIQDCMEMAKACPHYLFRKSRIKRHSSTESCSYCKFTPMDLEPYRERLKLATADAKVMFYALGADFILHCQEPFKKFFKDSHNYPQLKELFDAACPKIKELGLEMHHPKAFSICHVHMDSARHAVSNDFSLDFSPKALLKKRQLIGGPSLLDDVMREKGIKFLPRSERKAALMEQEALLKEKGICKMQLEPKRQRFPKR